MQSYLILIIIAAVFIFFIYLLIDFISIKGKANAFWDKWVRKTLWIWLPFYALQRLIKEVILRKK
jgi:hypothetical protein